MTNITGKIYQQTNGKKGAELENRFPRTVIEAVLGLNSYLQNQFSALADIYMPIEGISEAFTGQEFVYRKSPNTIKAKSITLDRIKGKTLAWNQLMQNSNFTDEASGWNVSGGTLSVSGGIATISATASTVQLYRTGMPAISGHKHLFKASVKFKNGSSVYFSTGTNSPFFYTTGNWQTIAYIDNTAIGDSHPRISTTVASVGDTIQVSCFYVVDLTLLYGSAIDGKTDAEILAMYEADFGTGYHEYNPGTLISNDAEAVETTGVNQWDEEWEPNMGYSTTTGSKVSASNRICNKNKIPVFIQQYYLKCPMTSYAIFYDANDTYLGYNTISAGGGVFTPRSGSAYMNFMTDNSYGATYNHDICINLSDPAINGQYFPYWKRTLQLGLNSFKVKDGNGNIITITGGLKSAGSVYDEIVGNKYIRYVSTRAYQSGDESNTSVTTDGHEYTNYPLATPIEYELVEPLIYTMKAGTTESRISPNSDGLSAPFCCDITYSANENNDAGNAQYAATAGRLLNSHKIWGQDFNGSEDVDGNLVANGTIQGTQLKSTVATGTAPLAVSSTTMVQNLVAEKASKLLTARTIWGQNFDGSGNISGAISDITTLSASGLATISGGIALGTSTKAQEAKMVWDEINNAWHLEGNLYVDGFVTAGGINNQE